MEDAIEKNKIPKASFPSLIIRHSKAASNNSTREIDYHVQLHEIYMYTFFKSVKKNVIYNTSVNSFDGHTFAPIQIKNFSLRHKIDEEEYFNFLLGSPLPFVFVPDSKFKDHCEMCKGAYFFRDKDQEGILMNLDFACKVGLDFMAVEYLNRQDICSVYIGLVKNC